ncbi:MAG: hypothetical protein J6333_04560 [Planctomycetes bacterium]|nr:hypothetical protein [Planctomycetota bacterium]
MVKKRDAGHPTGNGGAWKNSPLVGIALGVVIIACLGYIVYYFFGSGGNDSILPDNFPHAYLAAQDDGNYDAVLIKRGRRDTPTPFTENGKEYWPAYVCHNPTCPGLKGDKHFIFAAVRPPQENPAPNAAPASGHEAMPAPIVCPQCKAAMEKAKNANRSQYDMTAVERYQTNEGAEILNKIREEYRKNNRG